MLNKIKSTYKTIYVNVPNKYRIAFGEKLNKENLQRLRALSIFIVLLAPFMLFAHYQIYKFGFCDRAFNYCKYLFLTHYAGFLISFLFILLYKVFIKLLDKKKLPDIIVIFFILVFFLLFSMSSVASQFYTGNIVFFSMGAVLIGSLFVTFKRYTSIMYVSVLIVFEILLYSVQKNMDLLLVNSLNSTLAIFFAYSLNLILFHYKLEDFLKTKKIEIKSTMLNNTLSAIKKDISLAKKIQSSLIQKEYKTHLNLNFELAYIPLEEVGGDIYDISELGRHAVRIFLADATGHGVQAALVTMAIKSEYENLKKERFHSPKKIIRNLNQNFVDKFGSLYSFFSCVLVDIYPEKNKLIYSSAGHPDQILQLKNWEIKTLSRLGKLIGIHRDSEYEEREIAFEKGDKLFLYTDGLFEEFNYNKEEFGEKQIINIIKAYSDKDLKELFPILMKNMDAFLEHSNRQDDISFIAVEHI